MEIYVLILIEMGFVLKWISSRSLDNYIVGGRHIPWWALGVSGMANFLDLTGTAVIVSFLLLLGPQGLFSDFRGGAVLILVFMILHWLGRRTYFLVPESACGQFLRGMNPSAGDRFSLAV